MYLFIVQSVCLEILTLEGLVVLNIRVIAKNLRFPFLSPKPCWKETKRKKKNSTSPHPLSRKQNLSFSAALFSPPDHFNSSTCEELLVFHLICPISHCSEREESPHSRRNASDQTYQREKNDILEPVYFCQVP